jgi:hypothetical protein
MKIATYFALLAPANAFWGTSGSDGLIEMDVQIK